MSTNSFSLVSARLFPLFLLVPALLAGCSANFGALTAPEPVQSTLGGISGSVHGGEQPISGASIYVYAAGTSGYGGASTLLSTTPAITDANGNFTLTSDYTCASGQLVYLYVTGGDASGQNLGPNPFTGLMAAIGQCPPLHNFNLYIPHVEINEVSTIAAAYALAPFATDATHVSSSGTATALYSIYMAFLNAGYFYDITGGSGPTALQLTPGSETTVNYPNQGRVPNDLVNTLADILTACVNTEPTYSTTNTAIPSSYCSTLLSAATSDGTPTGTVPADTANAAINIAHHPAANVAALYSLVTGTPPFQPVIPGQPTDFALFVMWYGQTINAYSSSLAVDGFETYISGNNVTVIAVGGLFVTGHTGYPLGAGTIFLDNIGNGWIVNGGAVTEFSSASGAQEYTFSRTAPPFYPDGGAIDGSNTLWVTESLYQNNTYPDHETLDTFTSAGAMGSSSYINSTLQHPGMLAFDGSGNKWIIESKGVAEVSGAAVTFNDFGSGTFNSPNSLAVDHAGNVWVTDYAANAVVELSSGGSLLNNISNSGAFASPGGIAVDGLGQVWVANNGGTGVTELSNTGAVLSGTYGYNAGSYLYTYPGYGTFYSGGLSYPASPAIDPAGDLWLMTEGNGYYGGYYYGVAEFIGIAAPVVTPMAAAVAANAVGQRP